MDITLLLHITALERMKKSFTLGSVVHEYYEDRSSTTEAYLFLMSCFCDVFTSIISFSYGNF